jgi:hypothetical protein
MTESAATRFIRGSVRRVRANQSKLRQVLVSPHDGQLCRGRASSKRWPAGQGSVDRAIPGSLALEHWG